MMMMGGFNMEFPALNVSCLEETAAILCEKPSAKIGTLNNNNQTSRRIIAPRPCKPCPLLKTILKNSAESQAEKEIQDILFQSIQAGLQEIEGITQPNPNETYRKEMFNIFAQSPAPADWRQYQIAVPTPPLRASNPMTMNIPFAVEDDYDRPIFAQGAELGLLSVSPPPCRDDLPNRDPMISPIRDMEMDWERDTTSAVERRDVTNVIGRLRSLSCGDRPISLILGAA